MRLFIDTANTEHIRLANDLGVICGVTTNPSLIAKEGRDFVEVVKEITEIVDGPISAEVISMEAEGMLKEAEELVKIHKNIVIKIPMCAEGLKAASKMAKKGIKTNVTLFFSAHQALLAARAGATYVSPFVGRLVGAVAAQDYQAVQLQLVVGLLVATRIARGSHISSLGDYRDIAHTEGVKSVCGAIARASRSDYQGIVIFFRK